MKMISAVLLLSTMTLLAQKPIAHDSEYYVLEAQNGEKWA